MYTCGYKCGKGKCPGEQPCTPVVKLSIIACHAFLRLGLRLPWLLDLHVLLTAPENKKAYGFIVSDGRPNILTVSRENVGNGLGPYLGVYKFTINV